MSKILTKSGDSLADLYEVEGSIAGIEELETRELPIVHELGHTVFSERLGGIVRRANSGSIAQNVSFDVILATGFPGIWRIVSVVVMTTDVARVTRAQVSIGNADDGREVPIFVWDTTLGTSAPVRIVENGGVVGDLDFLFPLGSLQVPSLGVGPGQRDQMEQLVLRGLTAGFGAGTVNIIALIYVAFTHAGGLSSRGLPIPSW